MTDELKHNAALARAARADALLRDPLLVEAFDILEREYIQAWRTSQARDQDARERLFLAVNIVAKVRSHLKSVIADGRLSQAALDELAQREKIISFR